MNVSSYTYHYLFVAVFLVLAFIFALLPILLARVVAPRKPSLTKNALYECGLESEGDAWIQYRIEYYLFALLFVIFDVETLFIYPWAIAFKQLGLFAFVEMALFAAILGVGLIYAWRKNLLEWD